MIIVQDKLHYISKYSYVFLTELLKKVIDQSFNHFSRWMSWEVIVDIFFHPPTGRVVKKTKNVNE